MKSPSSSTSPDQHYFHQLLSERNQQPLRVQEIDAEITRAFAKKVAILALDMCGFSRLTAKHGIIHYLALIHQMHEAASPAVVGNGGQVVKMEADNLWAIFPKPEYALEAALDLLRSFDAINSVVEEDRDLHGSIGIGYGETLVIGGEDLYGDEMNIASKLGEDLAGPSEILLTAAAHAALPKNRYVCSRRTYKLTHFDILSFRYVRSLFRKPANKRTSNPVTRRKVRSNHGSHG
jgi:adenylate cyclase